MSEKRKKDHSTVVRLRLRKQRARAEAAQMAGVALAIALSLCLLAAGVWKGGSYLLEELVFTNPHLAIEHIEVETDGVLAGEQILKWAGVRTGENLLALDLSRVRRDLELAPVVASASIEKILPRQLRIRVVERKPLAQVYIFKTAGAQTSLMYLDADGFVIPPVPAASRKRAAAVAQAPLPVLEGLPAAELRPGGQVRSPQIRLALQIIAEFRRSPLAGLTGIQAVDVSAAQTLTLTTTDGGEVVLAVEGLARQFARWQTVLEYARRENRSLASLDLAVGNYVPVRWIEPQEPAPPPPLKPTKTINRKKNV